MTNFFREGLGLVEVARAEGWVEFEGLALHQIPAEYAEGIDTKTPRTDVPVKLVFEVADLEPARVHLIASGARMEKLRDETACDGVDPEGNVFQIVSGGRP